jgi:hypothetical protein
MYTVNATFPLPSDKHLCCLKDPSLTILRYKRKLREPFLSRLYYNIIMPCMIIHWQVESVTVCQITIDQDMVSKRHQCRFGYKTLLRCSTRAFLQFSMMTSPNMLINIRPVACLALHQQTLPLPRNSCFLAHAIQSPGPT